MNSGTLFELPDSPSPRLQWLRKHKVGTKERNDLGPDCPKWEAWVGDYYDVVNRVFAEGVDIYGVDTTDPDCSKEFVFGQSEDEALCELAKRNGWLLWNEELTPEQGAGRQ